MQWEERLYGTGPDVEARKAMRGKSLQSGKGLNRWMRAEAHDYGLRTMPRGVKYNGKYRNPISV